MKYTKLPPAGLGKLERARLSAILRNTRVTISVREAASILDMPATKTAKLLAWYAQKGWLSRVYYGVYIPVPLESGTTDIVFEDPLAIPEKLFAPCYIGGWSAVEYWGMTDQIFRSVIVMTQLKPKNRQILIKDTQYLLHTTQPALFFGLKKVWRSNIQIYVSDPTKTIIDLLSEPAWGGGLRPTVEILKYYFRSNEKNITSLVDYLQKTNNGAIYKRLGFLVEKYFPEEQYLIETCKNNLKSGKVKLDPNLKSNKLVTKWQLWVPEGWKEVRTND